MAKLIALYNPPKDPAHFDDYYFSHHAPLAFKVAGLRRFEVSRGPVLTPQGPSSFHLVATLTFDSMEALQQALASPEGQSAAADLANFATGGVTLLLMDIHEVTPPA